MTGATCSFENENTWELKLTSLVAAPRHLVTSRHALADGADQVVLPGGFACPIPRPGEVVTVPMDNGYLVHVERDGGDAVMSIELPTPAEIPVDDDQLAALATLSRLHATDDEHEDRRADPARALRRAWSYRRACEGLTAAFPDDGGPILPVRWVTLSWEGRVLVEGIGLLDVVDEGMRADLPDGRWIEVRRIDDELAKDGLGPVGAVEVLVGPAIPRQMPAPQAAAVTVDERTSASRPRGPRIRTSPRCVLLDD